MNRIASARGAHRPLSAILLAPALVWALGALGLVAAMPAAAVACSCIVGSRMSMYERATDVFLARVVDEAGVHAAGAHEAGAHEASAPAAVDATPTPVASWASAGAAIAGGTGKRHFTLEVTETLKGGASGRVDVDTPGDEAACGYPFEVGQTYVVFAHHGQHGLHTDLCSGTVTGEGLNPTLEAVRELSAYTHSHGGGGR
jgi:hypothetical protein